MVWHLHRQSSSTKDWRNDQVLEAPFWNTITWIRHGSGEGQWTLPAGRHLLRQSLYLVIDGDIRYQPVYSGEQYRMKARNQWHRIYSESGCMSIRVNCRCWYVILYVFLHHLGWPSGIPMDWRRCANRLCKTLANTQKSRIFAPTSLCESTAPKLVTHPARDLLQD